MKWKFSQKSKKQLESCKPLLSATCELALFYSKIDFGASQGYRSEEEQLELYKAGKTKVKKSKHNEYPSDAVDIFVANGYTWDYHHLCYIAGVFEVAFNIVKAEYGIEGVYLRWGGNWDSDGIILKDQQFQDLVHFELVYDK